MTLTSVSELLSPLRTDSQKSTMLFAPTFFQSFPLSDVEYCIFPLLYRKRFAVVTFLMFVHELPADIQLPTRISPVVTYPSTDL